jgi:hypothetical protein
MTDMTLDREALNLLKTRAWKAIGDRSTEAMLEMALCTTEKLSPKAPPVLNERFTFIGLNRNSLNDQIRREPTGSFSMTGSNLYGYTVGPTEADFKHEINIAVKSEINE